MRKKRRLLEDSRFVLYINFHACLKYSSAYFLLVIVMLRTLRIAVLGLLVLLVTNVFILSLAGSPMAANAQDNSLAQIIQPRPVNPIEPAITPGPVIGGLTNTPTVINPQGL